MEFRFPVNEVLKQPLVEIGQNLVPPGFSGDRRALWDTVSKVTEIVNAMGQASATAQGLTKPITTADRLRNSDQKIYLLVDQQAGNGRGAVTGMLKTGKKGLYVFDREGQHYQVSPPCVLDFYVHESRQRNGLGKRLFQHMLQKEEVQPVKMAIDRPSEKFLGFLNKHYSLKEPVKQMNNYVVFDGFFPGNSPQQEKSSPIENNNVSGAGRKQPFNGLQPMNYASPLGRYGAPRPPCSMGQIIHNQSSTIAATPEPTGTRSAPSTNYQQSSQYASPENVQSAPNMYYRSPEHHSQNQPQMSPSLHQAGDAAYYQTNPTLVQASPQSEINTPQSHLHQTAQNAAPQREFSSGDRAQALQNQIHHLAQNQIQQSQACERATAQSPQNQVNSPQNVEPSSQGQMQSETTSQQPMSQAEMQALMEQQQQRLRQQQQHIQMPGTFQNNVHMQQKIAPEKPPSARSGLQAPPVQHQANQQVSHDGGNTKVTDRNNYGEKPKPTRRVWPGGVSTVKMEQPQSAIVPKRMGLGSPRSASPTNDPACEAQTSGNEHAPQITQSAPQFNQNQQYVHNADSQPITTQPRMQAEWPSTVSADQVQSQSGGQYETRAQELATGHPQAHQAEIPVQQTGVQQSVFQPQTYQAVSQQLHAQQASTQHQAHVQAMQQAGMQDARAAQFLNNQHLEHAQYQTHQTGIQSQPHLPNAQHQTQNQPQQSRLHSVPAQLHPQERGAARPQPSNMQHLTSAQIQAHQMGIQSQPNLANTQHQIQPQQTSVQSVPNLASARGEPVLHPQETGATHDHPNLAGVQAQQQAASSPVLVQPQVHQTEAKHSHHPITVPNDPSQYYQQTPTQSNVASPPLAYPAIVDQPQQAVDAHQMGDHVRSAEQQKQQSMAHQAESAHARQDQSANSQQMSQPETKQANQYPAANLQHQQQMNQEVRSVEQQKQQEQAINQQAEVAYAGQNQSGSPQQMVQPERQQAYENRTAAANVQLQQQVNQEAYSVEPSQQYQQSTVQPALEARPGQHQSANPSQMAQPETNQAYQNRTAAAANVQHQQFVEPPQQYQQPMVQPAVMARSGTSGQYQSANAQQMAQPEANQAYQNPTVGANLQYQQQYQHQTAVANVHSQQQMNQEARSVEHPQQHQQPMVRPAVDEARPGQHQSANPSQMAQPETTQARFVEPPQQYQQPMVQTAVPDQAYQNPTVGANLQYQQQMNQEAPSPRQYQQTMAGATYPRQYQSASPRQMAPPTTNRVYQNPTTAAQPAHQARSRRVEKTDGISDVCSQRSTHRLYPNEQAKPAALDKQGSGDMKRHADEPLHNLEYGYPPQKPQNYDNQAAPLHAGEFKIGSSPKLERPRSLSIQLSEEQTDNKNGGVEVDGHEEVAEDDLEDELQKLAVEDNDVIPTKDINEAENSPTTNKKTPSHLTEQGFFDLKFYHSKLW